MARNIIKEARAKGADVETLPYEVMQQIAMYDATRVIRGYPKVKVQFKATQRELLRVTWNQIGKWALVNKHMLIFFLKKQNAFSFLYDVLTHTFPEKTDTRGRHWLSSSTLGQTHRRILDRLKREYRTPTCLWGQFQREINYVIPLAKKLCEDGFR